jgi:type IV secretion system protein TrbI
VTESVYDSATGRYLLIPQGSRLIGRYDSQVSFGQRRVLMVWTRLILPDTSSIALDRPASHVWPAAARRRVREEDRALLLGHASTTPRLPSPGAAQQSVQDTVNEVGKELTKKNLDVQPTLTIRPGHELRVMVNKDMVLRPYQPLFFTRTTP